MNEREKRLDRKERKRGEKGLQVCRGLIGWNVQVSLLLHKLSPNLRDQVDSQQQPGRDLLVDFVDECSHS